ncbi:MAG: histidine--tRNA ligase, partial [Acidimicrobiales bacterium]
MGSNVQPPRGMRDFLPEDKARRDGVLRAIREAFAAYGYREIETPVVEELSRLESGQGGDNERLIFRIQKRGLDPLEPIPPAEAADLGLRYDLTVPLGRFYATHRSDLPDVFRAIQIAPVWRAERPQRGRYRQFTQCDIDVLGEPGPVAEVELIAAAADALERLGVEGTSVRLNDRSVLTATLDACGFEAKQQAAALVSIDKLDKVGLDGVAEELASNGAAAEALDRLVAVLVGVADAAGDLDATLAALPGRAREHATRMLAVREGVGVAKPGAAVVVDPTLVRGMGYYTG